MVSGFTRGKGRVLGVEVQTDLYLAGGAETHVRRPVHERVYSLRPNLVVLTGEQEIFLRLYTSEPLVLTSDYSPTMSPTLALVLVLVVVFLWCRASPGGGKEEYASATCQKKCKNLEQRGLLGGYSYNGCVSFCDRDSLKLS